MDLATLIDHLRRAETFSEVDPGALPVEVVETHASVVLLRGERAWKLKKPVTFRFLDFSTLERRRVDCEEELRLNRRLLPEVYRGLAAACRTPAGVRVVRIAPGGVLPRSAEVLEWMIEMRRLPADAMFDRLLDEGDVSEAEVERFAEDLARFHASPATAPAASDALGVRFGDVGVLRRRIEDNLGNLARGAGAGPDPALRSGFVESLRDQTLAAFDAIAPELARRCEEGRVRDGHGDLHARNVVRLEGRLRAFDCLEFNPSYRCGDVAMEIAFLAMDLDHAGHAPLAERFIARYAAASGDEACVRLSRFFRLHYALVRAAVEALRLEQGLEGETRARVRSSVRTYAALAAGYLLAERNAGVMTLLLSGLPGTGKSTLARALGRALGQPLRATIVGSDRTRKAIAGLAPEERGGSGLYAASVSEATYAALADAIRAASGAIIVDAGHRKRSQRALTVGAAEARRAPWLLIEVVAPPSVALERIRARLTRATESDATEQVYASEGAIAEPADELPAEHRITVSSERPDWADEACCRVLEALLGERPVVRDASRSAQATDGCTSHCGPGTSRPDSGPR